MSTTTALGRDTSQTGGVADAADAEVLLTENRPASHVVRHATISWLGHPPGGEPRLTVGTHSLTPAPTLNVDVAQPHPLATSPAELLAGGFGVLFAKLLADQLVQDKTQASELVVKVTFTFSQDEPGRDMMLREISCELEARVAGIGRSQLVERGEQALRRTIAGLAMRPEVISLSLAVSLIDGSAPPSPAARSN